MSFLGAGKGEEPSAGAFPAFQPHARGLMRCHVRLQNGGVGVSHTREGSAAIAEGSLRGGSTGFLLLEEYAGSAMLSAPGWSFFIPTRSEPRCPAAPHTLAALPSAAGAIIPRISSRGLVTPWF